MTRPSSHHRRTGPAVGLLLTAALIAVLTACARSTPAATPASIASSGTFDDLDLIAPDRYDPPITMDSVIAVDATVKFLGDDDIQNNIWMRAYAEILGIDLNYAWVVDGSMYDQKLSLSINSGDIPDMFGVNGTQFAMLHEAGLLADLTDVYAAEASETTRDILTQDPVALKAATIDGRLYGIPLTDASIAGAPLLWVRQDWLDKLKIAAPTSVDDVLEISRRFSDEDPDGNGQDDTIGLAVTKDLWGPVASLTGFFNGYHAYPNIWFERDGRLIYGSVQPEMRAALAALQQMYRDGQIDPEFGVKDINKVTETIAQGKCGMEFGVWWNPYHPLYLSQQNEPDAFWSPFAIPSVDATPAKSQYSSAVGALLVVGSHYDHPEALIRMVNFWTDNMVRTQDDRIRQTFLGDINAPDVVLYKYTPIQMWEPNAMLTTGRLLREALAKHDPSGLNLDSQWRYRIIQAYFEQGTKEAWVEVATNGPDGAAVILERIAGDLGMINRFYGMPTPTMAEKKAALDLQEVEMITKVIMGDPLERFDTFVSDWHRTGGDAITEEVNAWYAENR